MNCEPYVITLHPGCNTAAAAKRAATYVVNRWLPGNAGGVHVVWTPRLTRFLIKCYELVNKCSQKAEIRVTVEGNVPVLTLLESSWSEP